MYGKYLIYLEKYNIKLTMYAWFVKKRNWNATRERGLEIWIIITKQCSNWPDVVPTSSCNSTWWRHPMETFSAFLAICAGNSPVPDQWRGALMFSLIRARISGWVNNGEAGDLRRYRVHCDVIVMNILCFHHEFKPVWVYLCHRLEFENNRIFVVGLIHHKVVISAILCITPFYVRKHKIIKKHIG